MPTVSGGGGSAYTPPTARAQYASAVAVSIANGATAPLPWDKTLGTALLDVTTPTAPTIVTAGTYALSVFVKGLALTAGGYFTCLVEIDSGGDDPQIEGFSNVATATLANPRILLPLTYYSPAGGGVSVQVTSKDGASTRDFAIVMAALQRLS